MPSVRKPRAGSLQFWPRVRSKRSTPRIRTHPVSKELNFTGFFGYKAGMTHVKAVETSKTSHIKGQEISVPVSIIECPPLKIASVRLYKRDNLDWKLKKEIILSNDKELAKAMKLPKKDQKSVFEKLNPEEYDDVRVMVFTLPSMTGIGKKKPDVAELGVGGPSVKEKLDFVKSNLGKEILVENVFKEGAMVDLKSFTKGKGFQGPIRRFGIHLRQSKSEKSIRNPGSLGPWKAQGQIMWRVAHAGKMGYHQRTEYNKQIYKIATQEEVNVKGGIVNYGQLKNKSVLVKGSIPGSKKRIIVIGHAIRTKKKISLPTIEKVSTHEKQGK